MNDFFANIYEWWGFFPFYEKDFGDVLSGCDESCEVGVGTPWYMIIGLSMLIIAVLLFVFQYYVYNRSNFNKKKHWWLVALILVIINFLIAFVATNGIIQSGNYCKDKIINYGDCIGFGFDNAIWSLILFIVITSIPIFRSKSANCSETTFWKP